MTVLIGVASSSRFALLEIEIGVSKRTAVRTLIYEYQQVGTYHMGHVLARDKSHGSIHKG